MQVLSKIAPTFLDLRARLGASVEVMTATLVYIREYHACLAQQLTKALRQ